MDHVINDQSSRQGDESYSQDLSSFAVDPSLINDPTWGASTNQYPHQDLFAPQQTYQYQNDHVSQYGGYGLPQASPYQAPSYTSLYAPQYQHSNPNDSYSLPSYGLSNSHLPTQSGLPYQGPSDTFQYALPGSESATISPQALQRFNVSPVTARNNGSAMLQGSTNVNNTFAQNWDPSSLHLAHNPYLSDGSYGNQMSARPGFVTYPSLPVNDNTVSTTSQTPAPKSGFGEMQSDIQLGVPNSLTLRPRVRVTHQELLSTLDSQPSRGLRNAPFVVLGTDPVNLSISGKAAKIPPYKPRGNRSGKPVIPGLDKLFNAARLNSSSKKSPSKTSTSKSKGVKLESKLAQVKDAKLRTVPGVLAAVKMSTSTPSPKSEVSSSEDETTTSDEESDYSDGDEIAAPHEDLISNHRSAERPTDVADAAKWDAIGVTFVSKHRRATQEEVVNGIHELYELVMRLRGEIKKSNTNFAKSEAEKQPADAKILSRELAVNRKALTNALEATVEHGHPDIVELLGKNPKLIAAFAGILMDCHKEQDWSGELPKAVLRLMSKCTTMTDDMLEKAKFFSLGKRFIANSDNDEIKNLIELIKSSTPEAKERALKDKKREGEDKKVLPEIQLKAEAQKIGASSKPSLTPSSLKRAREADTADNNVNKPNKKIASDSTAVSAPKAIKSAPAPVRTGPLFASMARSAQKPPLAAAAKIPSVKAAAKPPPPKPVAASTPQTSLADILASIEKPKEIPKPPPVPAGPPETAEEKKKRQRKESRRHLRVRWKEGEDLEQIRLFKHEQAEDEGRQVDMLRDAHDDRSEGMMHRQRVLQTSNSSDGMDEDDDPASEIEFRPYPDLMDIDFSQMDQSSANKNYTSRGGSARITTPQQQVQHRRESIQLMVVYTDPKDIPYSPKEPPYEISGQPETNRYLGQPRDLWVQQRLQEIRQYGVENARLLFSRRLEEKKFREDRARGIPAQQSSGANTDITSILNAMKFIPSTQSQQSSYEPVDAYQPSGTGSSSSQYSQINSSYQPTEAKISTQMDAAALANLERIIASLKGKPYPPVEPPEWMSEHGKAQWWEGYYRDNPAAAERKAAKDREMQLQAQAQAPHMATAQPQPHILVPPMQFPQIPGFTLPTPTNVAATGLPMYDTNQLQSILAGLQNGQGNVSQQPAQNDWAAGWLGANIGSNSYDQTYGSQNRDQVQQQWESSRSNNENARPGSTNQNQDSNQKRGRESGYGSEDRHAASHIRPNKNGDYKRNTKPCKFWQEGKCAKGANCTFRHD